MDCYPGTARIVGKCTRKKFFGLGGVCGGDIIEISKARTTESGELLYGPGLLIGYQCGWSKKK